jgi:hypothetical protein
MNPATYGGGKSSCTVCFSRNMYTHLLSFTPYSYSNSRHDVLRDFDHLQPATFEIYLTLSTQFYQTSRHPSCKNQRRPQYDHHDLLTTRSRSRPPPLYKNKNADEVSAIVIDIGTQTTRSGFAGEETPRSVVPTAFGYINLPSSHHQSNSNSGLAEQDAAASTSNADLDGMAVDAPSDRRTPEGESNLNGNTNGNKRGKVEKRFFMGDQGVNMWREGMEVGSLMRDGISQYQVTLSLYLHTYMYMHSPFFPGLTGRRRLWCGRGRGLFY